MKIQKFNNFSFLEFLYNFFFLFFVLIIAYYLLTFPSSVQELLRSLLLDSPELRATLATYKAGSITLGIGLISVPSSFSIRCKSNLSSYVIKLIAIPTKENMFKFHFI